MHITSDRLTQELSKIELLHIQSCTQCKIERKKLTALKISANQIDLITPPPEAWQNLAMVLPQTKSKTNIFKQYVYASAASIFMVSVGWLMWNNYNLQNQLEHVLLVNQTFELQLVQDSIPTFQQARLLNNVQIIERKLFHAKSTKEKLSLLRQRQELMSEILEQQKGENNEISI